MNIQDKEKIVFIGDSVTDAGRKRPVGEGLWEGTGNGYVRMIENFLNVCYPERIIHVANTGISGNTTNDLIARFDTDCLDLHPDTVVICIGFNDVWRYFDEPSLTEEHVSLETYAKNLEIMADRCREAGVRCIFMTPYYLEPNEKDLMRVKMDEYRGAMKQVAEAKALDCIDLQDAFDQLLQYRYPAYISWDRIHPGQVGSLVIAKTFLKHMGFDFARLSM